MTDIAPPHLSRLSRVASGFSCHAPCGLHLAPRPHGSPTEARGAKIHTACMRLHTDSTYFKRLGKATWPAAPGPEPLDARLRPDQSRVQARLRRRWSRPWPGRAWLDRVQRGAGDA